MGRKRKLKRYLIRVFKDGHAYAIDPHDDPGKGPGKLVTVYAGSEEEALNRVRKKMVVI